MKDEQEPKISISKDELKNILHMFDDDTVMSMPLHTKAFIDSMFKIYGPKQDDIDAFTKGFRK